MDAAVIGVVGSLLGVAIGVMAQQLQAKRNRQWQQDDSVRSHRWEQEDLLKNTKRLVFTQYLRSIDASYAQADAGVRTRTEDEQISTAVAEIELLSGPELSERVRSHSKRVLSLHDRLSHATDKTAIYEDVLAADKERMNLIALFQSDLGINDRIGEDRPRILPSSPNTNKARGPGYGVLNRTWEDRTDQAALMGAALAAIFATVISPGSYSIFDIVVGLALSIVLIGYYRPPPVYGWEATRKALALGAVAALLANVTFSWPVQEILLATRYFDDCGNDAQCVADEITVGLMPIVSTIFFLIGTLVGLALIRRSAVAISSQESTK
jgi:hypothetical protein